MPKANILVVEDEPKVAEVTKSILENLGYVVLPIVSTGEEAIKIVGRMRPDLVLMDIVLKGHVNGIEAAKQIHVRFNIPVIYLTGYADEEKLQQAKLTEPYGYILKPFKAGKLQATIEMTLYKHEVENKLKREVTTTLRSIGDAVITVNKEGLITFMNPVAESLTGWKQKIALNRDLTEVFNIKDKDRLSFEEGSAVKSIIDQDTVSLSSESILTSKEKTEILVEFKMTPIRDDEGIITGFVLVFRDIIERKKAEGALHESEERYRSLVESIEDPVYLIDKDLKYKLANKKFLSRLGKSRGEVVGQGYIKFHSYKRTKEFGKMIGKIFKSGKPVIYEHKSHRDGRDFLRTLSPVIDPETGSVIAITVISKDISERKRLEEILRDSEENFRKIFWFVPEPLLALTEQMSVLNSNKAFEELIRKYAPKVNISEEELRGKIISELRSHFGKRKHGFIEIKRASEKMSVDDEKKELILEIDFAGNAGKLFAEEEEEEEEEEAIVVSLKDITERKRAEEVLRDSDRMKSDFVSNVSHELRTPLASILGFSSTILRDKDIDEDTKEEFIEIIYEESQRLSRLIEDILNISRIESGKVTYKLSPIALEPIISEVFDTQRIHAEQKGIQISYWLAENLPLIQADRDAMKQVIVNLLSNGIKFTNKGGRVTISVKQKNASVILEVQDTGIGIPKSDQSKIFDKFYRVHRPDMETEGSGLGLSIVKEIVDFHKGRIEVFNEGGKGTLFRILFPIFKKE